jgi:hypothetical protein
VLEEEGQKVEILLKCIQKKAKKLVFVIEEEGQKVEILLKCI